MADKLIVDCTTGEVTTEPLTQAEEDDRAAAAQAAADREAEAQPAEDARTRLGELYAKGWANLTAPEKAEVPQLVVQLVGSGAS